MNERPETPIIIHVGMTRTGTTWLHNEVFPSHPDLNYAGRIEWDELLELLLEPEDTGKPLVIESHGISDPQLSLAGIAKRADLLKEACQEAAIILVTRDPISHLDSIYRTRVAGGIATTKKKFLASFDMDCVNHTLLSKVWTDRFDRVLVLPYELLKADPKLFIAKISLFIDVEPFQPANWKTVNRKLVPPLYWLMRLINVFVNTGTSAPWAQALRRAMQKVNVAIRKILQ